MTVIEWMARVVRIATEVVSSFRRTLDMPRRKIYLRFADQSAVDVTPGFIKLVERGDHGAADALRFARAYCAETDLSMIEGNACWSDGRIASDTVIASAKPSLESIYDDSALATEASCRDEELSGAASESDDDLPVPP